VTSPARRFAFIAGSGMDALAGAIRTARELRFDQIEGVGACGVEGHAGRVLEGTIAGRDCTLVVGRRHVYEGAASAVHRLIAWLFERGVTDLVTASAAGALHRGIEPGEVVVVRACVDFQGRAAREHGEAASRERPAHAVTIDPRLADELERAATRARVAWQRGTMVCGVGPAYETSAEVRLLQSAGGDVATMSSGPELAAAGRLGLRAAALAVVTNPCTGIAGARPDHREVLEVGRRASRGLVATFEQLVIK
jgi:purine-nucleoside phosphorylase